MARSSLLLFQCAIVSFALFGLINGNDHPQDKSSYPRTQIDIKTPRDYEKLRAGAYDKFTYVHVKPGAHPKILDQAKHWSRLDFYQIQFTDEKGNSITLEPIARTLTAKFTRGGLFHKLPTSLYRIYRVIVPNRISLTRPDENVLAQLQRSAMVTFYDRNGHIICLS